MKQYIFYLFILALIISCESKKQELPKDPEVLVVTALEVLHVKDYSYIKVDEYGTEKWLAAPLTDVKIGNTYYYKGAMEMKNFESKELQKTFETLYFIEKLSDNPDNTSVHSTLPKKEVEEIKSQLPEVIEPVETQPTETKEVVIAKKGELTIEELLKNSNKYQNKTITLKGKVTKFNPNILRTNWIKLQDGTSFEGVSDITITSAAETQIDQIITIKGIVALNKDLGHGYFYKVIIENAEIIK